MSWVKRTFWCFFNNGKKFRNYAIFGITSTLLNFVLYYLFTRQLGIGAVLSSVIVWFIVVFFVYVTNRQWVFGSDKQGRAEILKELLAFYFCRVLTGVLDWIIMFVFVDVLHFWDLAVKVSSICVVVLLNFLTSNFLVFSKKSS